MTIGDNRLVSEQCLTLDKKNLENLGITTYYIILRYCTENSKVCKGGATCTHFD